ncbi:MAG: ribonuclease D, partial [Deltaproteobacteria bacterium]
MPAAHSRPTAAGAHGIRCVERRAFPRGAPADLRHLGPLLCGAPGALGPPPGQLLRPAAGQARRRRLRIDQDALGAVRLGLSHLPRGERRGPRSPRRRAHAEEGGFPFPRRRRGGRVRALSEARRHRAAPDPERRIRFWVRGARAGLEKGLPQRSSRRLDDQAAAGSAAVLPFGGGARAGPAAPEGARIGARGAEGDSGARERVVKPAAVDRLQQLVDSPGQVAACVDDVARSSRIGLDTESNGFHAYYEKVCLLQISTEQADWAIDTLALAVAPLLPLLADRARECILHAAEYDVLCMKRDYGFSFGRIFDTHAAAKTLGIERVGLHDLLADQLGVQLAVDEQRSDWGKRPLSPEQLEYAFADVRHLLPLREKLGEQLVARGLLAEAEAEFARLIAKEPRPREFDPEGWRRMKAA